MDWLEGIDVKLVALKDLSDKLPTGTEFEWRDDHAVTLIAAGLARAAADPADAPADESSSPRAGRGRYRRRDLRADDGGTPAEG